MIELYQRAVLAAGQTLIHDRQAEPIATPMLRTLMTVCMVALFGWHATVRAQDAFPTPADILTAVVGVRAVAADDSRTGEMLGKVRHGSGVIIDNSGLVLTIGYLILEAESVEVITSEGYAVTADVLGYDYRSGLGLIRTTEVLDVRPLPLGDSNTLALNDPLVIASFGGVDRARPAFLVSRDTFAGYWEYLLEQPLMTFPPFDDYGGAALISAQGELMGIGSLSMRNINFNNQEIPGNMFIAVDVLPTIIADLISVGYLTLPPQPWLGLYLDDYEGPLVIRQTANDGPAFKAKLRPGDVIVELNHSPVTDLTGFYRRLWSMGTAGITVPLKVKRDTDTLAVEIVTENRQEWYRIPARN